MPVYRVVPLGILHVLVYISANVLNEPEDPPKILLINSIPYWTYFCVFIFASGFRPAVPDCHRIVTAVNHVNLNLKTTRAHASPALRQQMWSRCMRPLGDDGRHWQEKPALPIYLHPCIYPHQPAAPSWANHLSSASTPQQCQHACLQHARHFMAWPGVGWS